MDYYRITFARQILRSEQNRPLKVFFLFEDILDIFLLDGSTKDFPDNFLKTSCFYRN